MSTTTTWEKELNRLTKVDDVFNPGHIKAVTEVIRLRQRLESLADWHDTKAMKARTYPAPGKEEEGQRAAKVHAMARHKIHAALEGDDL